MNAPSDSLTSCESPEGDLAGTAPVQTQARPQLLKGVSMVAAYRAARASQRSELRASLHQTHLARRRSREERLGRDNARPDPVASIPVVEVAHAAEPAPAAAESQTASSSVFANLVSLAVAERGGTLAPVDAMIEPAEPASAPDEHETDPPAEISLNEEPAASDPDPCEASATDEPPPAEESPAERHPAAERAYDPPLAEIGFGPGMLIRLSQLGMHTTGDLAQADASELRAALGDISRLVDVETWISNARQTTRTGG